jgi:hypothetical protein
MEATRSAFFAKVAATFPNVPAGKALEVFPGKFGSIGVKLAARAYGRLGYKYQPRPIPTDENWRKREEERAGMKHTPSVGNPYAWQHLGNKAFEHAWERGRIKALTDLHEIQQPNRKSRWLAYLAQLFQHHVESGGQASRLAKENIPQPSAYSRFGADPCRTRRGEGEPPAWP